MPIRGDSPPLRPEPKSPIHKPPIEAGLAIFSEIFNDSPPKMISIIYRRMVEFAQESGMSEHVMVERVLKGFEIAKKISTSGEESYLIQSHPTEDLINLDWFLRAQMAKMNKLYMKGTVKFPDPGNRFLTFIVHTKSTFHGSRQEPKGRWTSHWPEHQELTQGSTDLKLTDSTYVCFSETAMNVLIQKGVRKSNIKNFGKAGICIDASGPKSNPRLGLPGKNNTTYLIQSFQEKNSQGEEVQVIGMKTEGFSAVAITEKGYGDLADRVNDNVLHMAQWFKKKGPGKVLSLSTPESPDSPYRDLKEDKLRKDIKKIVNKIQLLPKETVEGEKCQKILENLKASYKELEKTTGGGSDYGIKELKNYLKILDNFRLNQVFLTEDEPTLLLIEGQLKLIGEAIVEIDALESYYTNYRIRTVWEHTLLPRSEEVILPTLQDMVNNKVPFVS